MIYYNVNFIYIKFWKPVIFKIKIMLPLIAEVGSF